MRFWTEYRITLFIPARFPLARWWILSCLFLIETIPVSLPSPFGKVCLFPDGNIVSEKSDKLSEVMPCPLDATFSKGYVWFLPVKGYCNLFCMYIRLKWWILHRILQGDSYGGWHGCKEWCNSLIFLFFLLARLEWICAGSAVFSLLWMWRRNGVMAFQSEKID